MSAHAVFSPSGAVLWTTCLAGLIHGVDVESVDTEHSRTGTAAHALLESLIARGDESMVDAEHRALIDDEMRDHIADVYNALQEYAGPNGLIFPEMRVNFSEWVGCPEEMGFGTSDAFIIREDGPHRELQVHDLKYGMGILVDAEENMQLMLYALGALLDLAWLGPFDSIRLVIHQPRRGHTSEWVVTRDRLIRFAYYIREVVQLYLRMVRDGAPVTEDLYSPSPSACQFCKIKATCPKLTSVVYRAVEQDHTDLVTDVALGTSTYRVPLGVTPEEMGNRLHLLPLVQQWATATKQEAMRRLLNGEPIDGYKLVRSKGGRRKWSSEDDVMGALRIWKLPQDEVAPRKLVSPTKIEKMLKKAQPERWDALQSFIEKKPGAPAIAPASDPRPVLDNINADDFDVIDEE